jgi:hypothetical protein
MARPIGVKNKVRSTRGWTEEQLKQLVENYYQRTDVELSVGLKKSVRQLRVQARKLGLKPKIGL